MKYPGGQHLPQLLVGLCFIVSCNAQKNGQEGFPDEQQLSNLRISLNPKRLMCNYPERRNYGGSAESLDKIKTVETDYGNMVIKFGYDTSGKIISSLAATERGSTEEVYQYQDEKLLSIISKEKKWLFKYAENRLTESTLFGQYSCFHRYSGDTVITEKTNAVSAPPGILIQKTIWKEVYNRQGFSTYAKYYPAETPDIYTEVTVKYDTVGNMTEVLENDLAYKMKHTKIYQYNKSGLLANYKYLTNGREEENVQTEYEFSIGEQHTFKVNVKNYQLSAGTNRKLWKEEEIVFDSRGNWIRKTVKTGGTGLPGTSVNRKITYY
jgi:hypothetical protein